MPTSTAFEQIEQLEKKILALKQQALAELKEQLAAAQKTVAALEKELAELTGEPVAVTAPRAAARRPRRPSISDEDLKPLILRAMAEKGMTGLNAKDIAAFVGQDPMRIRKFMAQNPGVLKRQGSGPGTRFFLR
ncbi:MAG: hypothetical protein WCH57_03640 [Verrucomicrobiota bacterium]